MVAEVLAFQAVAIHVQEAAKSPAQAVVQVVALVAAMTIARQTAGMAVIVGKTNSVFGSYNYSSQNLNYRNREKRNNIYCYKGLPISL